MKHPAFSSLLLALCTLLFTGTMTRADDLKAMEGTWKVAMAEAGGKKIESADFKGITVTVKGETYEVEAKGVKTGGTMKLDETKTPKTMDGTDTEGQNAGKQIRAIYELTGDTLRVCYAIDGGERPTELASSEGKPWLLLTYQREKKAE